MRNASLCLLFALAGLAQPARAHRLDEYLQATKVSIGRDHVRIDLDLTPGVAVFGRVFANIDRDYDGEVSAAEQQAYALQVADDLSLTVDGKTATLRLSAFKYPDLAEMREGQGTIALQFDSDVPAGNHNRVLVFENHHLGDVSVYLANCLVPTDSSIHIDRQNRSIDQTEYRVDYTQDVTAIGQSIGDLATPRVQTTSWSLFESYIGHGIRHILTGYDHLLFVCALVLAATTLWDLIKVVSAFTIAHTITLTLAALGVVHVSERIVEPLSAASILVVALQNVFWPSQAKGWARLTAAFFFWLFHGLGFAGGLLDAMRELPGGAMLLAILAFSIGVEIGHQLIVIPLFTLLKVTRRVHPDILRRTAWSTALQRYGSAAISIAGAYYLWMAVAPAP